MRHPQVNLTVEEQLWFIQKEITIQQELDKLWHQIYVNANTCKRRKKQQFKKVVSK